MLPLLLGSHPSFLAVAARRAGGSLPRSLILRHGLGHRLQVHRELAAFLLGLLKLLLHLGRHAGPLLIELHLEALDLRMLLVEQLLHLVQGGLRRRGGHCWLPRGGWCWRCHQCLALTGLRWGCCSLCSSYDRSSFECLGLTVGP